MRTDVCLLLGRYLDSYRRNNIVSLIVASLRPCLGERASNKIAAR